MNNARYCYLDMLSLTGGQRGELLRGLQHILQIGRDGYGVFFLWDNFPALIVTFKTRIAALLRVEPDNITHKFANFEYSGLSSQMVVLLAGGFPLVTVTIFGGAAGTVEESEKEYSGFMAKMGGANDGIRDRYKSLSI